MTNIRSRALKSAPGESVMAELLEENAVLREEVRVARQASDITAQLVVQQFVKTEEVLLRLEEQARVEQELGHKLGEKLHEAEIREQELNRDRKRLEDMQIASINMMEDIAAARLAAEAATRAKSAFLANMSHEIRTPMTAILGYLELIAESCPRQCGFGATEHQEYLGTISRNADHLLRIINDILDLSKIEAGKLAIEQTQCSVVQLVAEVGSLMRSRANGCGLRFETEFVGSIPERITSDPMRLKQILINLVGNAIKFTETGGVRLVTRLLPASSANADQPGESMLQFEVIDTGIGMTPEQLSTLFQPFSQADASTTRRFGGTGLGLTITKRLTNSLGGDVAVESRPGQGSTFRVTIATGPLAGVKMLENPAEASTVNPVASHECRADVSRLDCRILLAEDGPDNQRLIAAVLGKAGADVVIVEDGRMAVEKALAARDAGDPFDVILMDMQMPVLDGYEATQSLRRKGYTDLIIALTAHAMAGQRQKCLAAGCDDYASKPIDRRKLMQTIHEQLSKRKTRWLDVRSAPQRLVSELAGDPDLADLVADFVAELPARVDALYRALVDENLESLTRLAHQLKGAAGSYGFPLLSQAAADIEQRATTHETLDELGETVRQVAELCRHVQLGAPPGSPDAKPEQSVADMAT